MQGPTRENWRTVFNLALWSLRDRGKFNHLASIPTLRDLLGPQAPHF